MYEADVVERRRLDRLRGERGPPVEGGGDVQEGSGHGGRLSRRPVGGCLWHPVPINVRCGPPERRQEQSMAPTGEIQPASEEPLVEETLVEEVSIDGMCGVY
ncbi:hypothetical protein GCM10009609_58600 [Pseudonocardia aurantiaca]